MAASKACFLSSLFFLALHGASSALVPGGPGAAESGRPLPLQARDACAGNTADARDQWCDYSIDTDYYSEVPDTGVTREYWLDITDVTVSPDGVSRAAMAVNGSIPGPTLFADWGDTVTVHVTNSLTTSSGNGSSLHFHGIRQNYTNQNDGVVSITQCPSAVGETDTYTWRATQYGSTWYHSHFGLAAWEGVFGGIVINGPATSNYDEDLGVLFIQDWDHQTADERYIEASTTGPPTLATGLINGTNTFDDGGERYSVQFTSGTSYRLRLVNPSVDTHFKFQIDNHTLTVIASDLVPVTPYETTFVNVGMGQRYDIIVTADQADTADNFWMRAVAQTSCSENDNPNDILGIVYYGDSASEPETSEWETWEDSCDDETWNLVPHVSKTVGSAPGWSDSEEASTTTVDSLFKWTLNSTTMVVDWEDPTLMQVLNGEAYADSDAVIELPDADQWVYLVIETGLTVTHPIHLHGHDFFVIGQSYDAYDPDTVSFNLTNPARRDTAMLYSGGYLALAWQTDNPGAWLMHCHIGWHVSQGFALQFVERADEIPDLIDQDKLNSTCSAWSSYQSDNSIVQEDSGI